MRKLKPSRRPSASVAVFAILACLPFMPGCEQSNSQRELPSLNSAIGVKKQKLLEGSANSPAHAALYNYSVGEPVDLATVSVADGRMVIRTGLQVWFVPGATVGEINSLLRSIDGSIIGMMSGVDMLYVQIPDTGNLKAVLKIKYWFESKDVVRYVVINELSSYPEDVVFDPSELTEEERAQHRRIHCALGDCNLGLVP